MTTCPTCGANNAFDSKFCSQCASQLGGGATPVDPGAPRAVATPYSPYVPPMPPGYDAPRSSNATTILVLGILSLVVCGVLGPIAWWMGHSELRQIDAGLVSRDDRGTVNAGYICGIIGSVLMLVSVLFVVLALGMMH